MKGIFIPIGKPKSCCVRVRENIIKDVCPFLKRTYNGGRRCILQPMTNNKLTYNKLYRGCPIREVEVPD